LFNIFLTNLNMKENRYSIKDLENLTHIKAHTIRIWEQRYGLLQPQRTDTNIRYYADKDLRKILNVNLLYANGFKISKIAALNEEQILKAAESVIDAQRKASSDQVPTLMNFIMKLDESGISNMLNEAYKSMGMAQLYSEVIIPTLVRIGELWQLNTLSIAHEHFFTALLRNFIVTKLNGLAIPKKTKKVVFFLHAEEEHEMSLLIYHYLFRKHGLKGIYLGPNLPMSDLIVVIEQEKPDFVVTNFVKYLSEIEFKEIIDEIYTHLDPEQLFIGGGQAMSYTNLISKKSRLITDSNSFNEIFV